VKLLNQLEEHAGKKAYQTYTVTHGIESFNVMVPLEAVQTFEGDFNGVAYKSKENLLEVVARHSGKIKAT
jgi:hypothetical protein